MFRKFEANEGSVSVEYVAILVCIAVAVIVAFGLLGGTIKEAINNVKDKLDEQLANATNTAAA